VTDQERLEEPRLTVVGSGHGTGDAGSIWAAMLDGSAASAVGGAIAGGFGIEALKTVMTGEAAGRWWFFLGCASGLALILLGFWLRGRAPRRLRVGIVVTAVDARRGLVRARQLDQQAEAFSRNTCALTLKTEATLSGDVVRNRVLVDRLADETLAAAMMAERLTPDAARINLIPTMPLNVAFWFGARLGHTHAREVAVHAIRQADGSPPYFPATVLRAVTPKVEPLVTDRLEAVDGGDPSNVALALDLQGFGDQFFDQVMAACRKHNIGFVLRLHRPATRLAEDRETFTGIVEQTCRTWREAPLPAQARTGDHAVFLTGPVAISVALGARLAAPDKDKWTAFTFDDATNQYEPFPVHATTP
jgi:hypothetical protein